ncbi:MAG: Arc family DNA-binding protein [Phyllobacteriaceae bacterium]|nr:Arc family DNA-binding protein [Phyllobacteriaceae bacterium]
MAQLVVRRIDESVKSRLAERAARHGRSVEAEVRAILQDAVKNEGRLDAGLGSRIAARFTQHELADEITEIRGAELAGAEFGP